MEQRAAERWDFIIVLSLILLVFSGFLFWQHYRGGVTDLRLTGRIIISDSGNFVVSGDTCRGVGDLAALQPDTEIAITPSDEPMVHVPLEHGALTSGGVCEIRFVTVVPDAFAYRFHINGLPGLVRHQYLYDVRGETGDLELNIILRWD